MDEAVFWRTMNPRRLHALFDAWFNGSKKPQRAKMGLSKYLMGG